MSNANESPPQLTPTGALQNLSQTAAGGWFEYPVRAQPHHTDYSGNVWHGGYLSWMEEARVESLRSIGIDFADLVALGCDFLVVELSMRYHLPIRLGMTAVVRARMSEMEGVRLNWDYQIQSPDGKEVYVASRVTLVAVDLEKGKIMRQLPPAVKDSLVRLSK